jgi:cytochrome c biogenesis protein CcmG, thiol:disulfide interchange protein DsbE
VTTASPPTPPAGPAPRQPRKIFLVVGLLLAAVLGVGLFTSLGSNKSTSAPHDGGRVPAFSAPRLNGSGGIHIPLASGTPTVLLFFGKWCPACHAELPPLAAAVHRQDESGGSLSRVHVIGVDSEDTVDEARSFIKSSGVTFPVAGDPNIQILSGDFYLRGDPNAVFVKPDGRISRIVQGDTLTPASFTADERALIPSGS